MIVSKGGAQSMTKKATRPFRPRVTVRETAGDPADLERFARLLVRAAMEKNGLALPDTVPAMASVG